MSANPAMRMLARQLRMRESIASVALSHPEDCTCDICKAASGDEQAFNRVAWKLEGSA